MASSDSRRGSLAFARACGAAACWGLAAIFAKHGFEHGVPPVRMAAARVLVAWVVLALLLAWRRRDLVRPPAGAAPLLAAFGACVASVNLSYYIAIDRLAVGVAISLQYTGPVLVLLWTALVTRRSPGRLVWGAAAVTLAGAVLVSQALQADARLDPAGLAAAMGSAVTFGATLLTAEALGRRHVPPATVLLWGFAVAVAIWSVAAPWWSFPVAALADRGVLAAVLGVGVVGTLIPFFLEVGAVRVLPAALVGIAATAEPVFAAAFAWVLLSQELTGAQLAGGALVVVGVALAQATHGGAGAPGAVSAETSARTAAS
ncbi:MAG TPA: EamA family transporter [Actinomycetes bacterium]|nr:EamA family transporter [Actinomycetes bacterium]